MVEEDVADYFSGTFLEDAPILRVSSTSGAGIEAVKETLDRLVAAGSFSEAQGPFRLPVDRIFSMKGFGAVVTGTSVSGRLALGDEVGIYPAELAAKVRGIQVHGETVAEVEAGRRTAINLQGVDLEQVAKGDMLAHLGTLTPSYMLDCDFLYLASNRKGLKNRTRVRVHIGTAEIMGRVVLLLDEEAAPGGTFRVQILLEKPVGAWPGDRYVVRSYSPVRTIGGGRIYNACPGAKRRRFKEVNKSIFALYEKGTQEELALFHIAEGGFAGLTFAELGVRLGLFGNPLKKLLKGPVSARKIVVVDSERQRYVAEEIFKRLQDAARDMVSEFHRDNPMLEGIGKEELRSRLYGGIDSRLFQVVLNGAVKGGKLLSEGALVRLPEHQVSLEADEAALKGDMEAYYLEGALKPPTVRQVKERFSDYPKDLVAEVLALLGRDGVIQKVTEELYYHHASLEEIEGRLTEHLRQHGEIDAQGFKGLSGLSRKFSIPLLEYFDRKKLTIRVADKRVLRGG